MNNFKECTAGITAVLEQYFKGIYSGDVALLNSTFHPQALVFGDISGQSYFKTLSQYLEGVKNRKSPQQLGEPFKMEILSIEIINSIAVAKVHIPMLGFNYYDLLSLNKVENTWVIVNKLLTHVNI